MALTALLDALRLLTRLPLGSAPPRDDRSLAAAAPWFPLAGVVVGGIGAAAYAAAAPLWGTLPAAVLATLAAVAVTGALHLDGLADTADGLGRGGDPHGRLEAMRDPRTGALGAAAVAADLLLRAALLAALPPPAAVPALLVAAVAGRWAMVSVMPWFPYARAGGGLGRPFAAGVRLPHLAGAAAVALLAVAGCTAAFPLPAAPRPWAALAALAAAPAAGFVLAVPVARRLGGLTGDVYGAVNETAELAALALLAALARAGG